MRRSKTIAFLLFFLLWTAAAAGAEEPTSVYDAIENSKGKVAGQQPQKEEQPAETDYSFSLFPFFIKLFVSLTFIILLIYLLLKFWAQKTRGMQARGPFLVLGGCALGTNRSLQAVMIGKTIYLLGVGENVQLIRQVSPGDEYDLILSSFESQTAPSALFGSGKWFQKPSGNRENSWEDQLQAKMRELQDDSGANVSEWMNRMKEGENRK